MRVGGGVRLLNSLRSFIRRGTAWRFNPLNFHVPTFPDLAALLHLKDTKLPYSDVIRIGCSISSAVTVELLVV